MRLQFGFSIVDDLGKAGSCDPSGKPSSNLDVEVALNIPIKTEYGVRPQCILMSEQNNDSCSPSISNRVLGKFHWQTERYQTEGTPQAKTVIWQIRFGKLL